MRLQQTREPLEHEDYKIFYHKFKKEFYNTVVYTIIIHSMGFGILSYIENINVFWFIFYVIFTFSIWKKIYYFFLFYKRVYKYPHKIVWKGKILEKIYKTYLINGEKQQVPIFIFSNQEELLVTSEIYHKFYVSDVVALYSLEAEDEFFRYEVVI